MKKTSIFFILVFSTMLVITAPTPVDAIYSYKIGEVTETYDTPVFVLYDPPGDHSYSSFSTASSVELGMRYEHLFGVAVQGAVTHLWERVTKTETPANEENAHSIFCLSLAQTWELWYVETVRTSYYKLKLASSVYKGYAVHEFDTLPSYVVIQDKTGTTGAYKESRVIAANRKTTDSFHYEFDSYHQLGFGIKIQILGMAFELIIQAVIGNNVQLDTSYTYHDYDDKLVFDLCSDVTFAGVPDMSGNNIWFNDRTQYSNLPPPIW